MTTFLFALLAYVRTFLNARHSLAMETVALRQQLIVYKRKQPRPKLNRSDRLFWVLVRRIWSNWSEALIFVKPDTVISWHRTGYRLFWRWRSRPQRVGRPKMPEEIRQLIRRMKRENPSWGAPRIHGELLLLGFDISEPTVSRYLQQLKRIPDESNASQWHAFLINHREVIAAFDFFTVPNLNFRTLYCCTAILGVLQELGSEKIVPKLLPLLDVNQTESVRLASLHTLARFDKPSITAKLLGLYPEMPSGLKSASRDVLFARVPSAAAFLDRVEASPALAKDVPITQVRLIAALSSKDLDARVRKTWGNVGQGTPEEKLATIRRFNNDLRATTGDPKTGVRVFNQICVSCHRLYGSAERSGRTSQTPTVEIVPIS
jgi:hypothetical protein